MGGCDSGKHQPLATNEIVICYSSTTTLIEPPVDPQDSLSLSLSAVGWKFQMVISSNLGCITAVCMLHGVWGFTVCTCVCTFFSWQYYDIPIYTGNLYTVSCI